MDSKHFLAKVISILLILSGIYQIFLSSNAIFFIYPHLNPRGREVLFIQEGLIEKALILYASMVVTGIYGVVLLFKPEEEVKIIDILSGILIFLGSIFFVIKTPFTTDPILELIKSLVFDR